MKGTVAFIFFMLFLAGIAFVNLRGMQGDANTAVTSSEQLTDVAWRPTNLGEMAVDETTEMVLQFDSDNRVAGHAGCNRFFGGYEVKDGTLIFSMIGSTRMACQEPANSMEISFLEALGNVKGAARAEGRLALRDGEGRNLIRFAAVPRDES